MQHVTRSVACVLLLCDGHKTLPTTTVMESPPSISSDNDNDNVFDIIKELKSATASIQIVDPVFRSEDSGLISTHPSDPFMVDFVTFMEIGSES